MVKKNYPPGLHGQKGFVKVTEYGKQLQAKQRAKKSYCVDEKQFRNYFKKALAMKGNVSVNFLTLLEKRFDNVVYKSGLAVSRGKARQLINHAHFMINGRKVNIPSYGLKEKDMITVKEKSKKSVAFDGVFESIKPESTPEWLSYDPEEQGVTMVSDPQEKDFDPGIDTRLIVEYYSK